MKKVLVVVCLGTLLLAGTAIGQNYQNWTFDKLLFEHVGGGGLHGVVVAPDGNIWICAYGDYTDTIIVNYDSPWVGDTLAPDTGRIYPLYIIDPTTGQQVSFSPLGIIEFADGSKDTVWNGSDWNGTGKGISLDKDGNILWSSWSTLYRINYQTGQGMNRFYTGDHGLPASSLTEAVQDTNGLIYCSYVLGGGKPIFMLDNDFNYIGNAADDYGHINRSWVVTPDGKDLYSGSTWNGMGIEHWHSDIPGVLQYTPVDTLGNLDSVFVDSQWVGIGEPWKDTSYWAYDVVLWAECVDWGPDGMIWAGETYIGWSDASTGSRWYIVDPATGDRLGSVGIPMGDSSAGGMWTPRGAAWSADGNTMYLCDFDYNIVGVWTKVVGVEEISITKVPAGYELKNYPNPFVSATNISFAIPKSGLVELKVYDVLGREVRALINEPMVAGKYNITFNATDMAAGVYYYRLVSDNQAITKKMLIVK